MPDTGDGGLALAHDHDGLEADGLGELDALVDGVDRPAGDARRGDDAEPLHRRAGGEPLDEQRSELAAVRGAVLVAREPRVVGELGHPEDLDEPAELAVVARRDDEVAVGAGQRLVREEAGVAVAHPARDDAARDEGTRLVDQPREGRAEQVDLDVLTAAGLVALVEGREDADARVQPGHDVEDRDPRAVGRALGVAGQAHQPRDGLDHEVVAGQVASAGSAAEAADRGVDDAGVVGADAVVVEPEPRQAPRLEVLDEDVGPPGELAGRRPVVVVLEVQRHRALVAVDPEVVRRDAVAHRRAPRPGVVAAGRLDLDHLGAEVGEEHRRVGAGEDPGEVGDEEPGERTGPVRHGGPPLTRPSTDRCPLSWSRRVSTGRGGHVKARSSTLDRRPDPLDTARTARRQWAPGADAP